MLVLLLIVSFKNRTNGDVISRKREMEALKACCKDEMSDPLAEYRDKICRIALTFTAYIFHAEMANV